MLESSKLFSHTSTAGGATTSAELVAPVSGVSLIAVSGSNFSSDSPATGWLTASETSLTLAEASAETSSAGSPMTT